VIVVADTSVLINLCRVGQGELFGRLFGEVIIPPEVANEFARLISSAPRFAGLSLPVGIRQQAATTVPPLLQTATGLDPGEFAALALAVLAIGTSFAIAGAWLILPFAGLEVLLLGGAFVLQARHATDYERIALEQGQLRVEVADGKRLARYELDARRVRVEVDGSRVVLRGPQEALELGRHLDERSRIAFGAELKKRLRI